MGSGGKDRIRSIVAAVSITLMMLVRMLTYGWALEALFASSLFASAIVSAMAPDPHPRSSRGPSAAGVGASRSRSDVPVSRCP